jgi:hypothetical protein
MPAVTSILITVDPLIELNLKRHNLTVWADGANDAAIDDLKMVGLPSVPTIADAHDAELPDVGGLLARRGQLVGAV